MGMIDLHVHTNQSDGQYAPAQVVEMAKELGVSLLAITDHDTVAGLEEGALAARQAGISLIPGIEISVRGNRELHILGYCVDPSNPGLTAMCREFLRQRNIREERIFQYLEERGVHLTRGQVLRHTGNGLVGRPHFARAMTEAGYVSTPREAFDRYLGTPEFDRIERPKPSPQAGIRVIREAGGVAVLAHPGLLGLEAAPLEALLRELVEAGLQGIECHYSTHTPGQTALCLALAERYGLVVTGGSDYHGEKVKPKIQMGTGMGGNLRFDNHEIENQLLEASRHGL